MSPTLKDVARLAGVHPATVSRALDPAKLGLVSADTRVRVETAARELGYRTDAVARSLRRGQTTTVGVLVADLGNPFVSPFLRGIAGALERHGFMALIGETQDEHDRLRAALENLLSRRADAIVVTSARRGDRALLEEAAREAPVVLAVRALPGTTLPAVCSDDVAGGYLAATHLAELGHRRVAELAGSDDVQPFRDRSTGFAHGARDGGLDAIHGDDRAAHPTVAEGRRLMELALAESPSAVFAHNDAMAIGAIEALRAAGLRCPQDVSVLGYNDAPLTDHLQPPLSTIRFPSEQIGRGAAEIAIAAIEDSGAARASMRFPPELVPRESTARLRRRS